jgi:tRNA U34 5-methylaminomethyl-2-thiouridine-forming methyltransferase MnmC
MERKLIKTEDGSHTIYVPELGEHYHSIHGAVTESTVIYIDAAFRFSGKNPVRVLEFGMGTGMNVLLTCLSAEREHREVYYHTIEKYPVTAAEYQLLNLSDLTHCRDPRTFTRIHEAPWNTCSRLSETFTIFKEQCDFREATPVGTYDVIYFDAFAPEVQPALWSEAMFRKVYSLCSPGAVLTTYSSKGTVRRHLLSAGFSIEKLLGPPGKREFIRAVK